MLSKLSILGVSITTSPKEEILAYCQKYLSSSVHHRTPTVLTIVTPNPEQIVLAGKNASFRTILNAATIALPDGAGLVWALNRRSKILGLSSKINNRRPATHDRRPKVSRIPGREFMVDLCRLAGDNKRKVLFVGGKNGVAKQALEKLQSTIPHLRGVALDGPELPETPSIPSVFINEIMRTVRANNIACVFFGFGAPKQEFLMDSLTHTFKGTSLKGVYSNLILMSVGGSFDIISGNVARTPRWMQKLGLEWLYRLIREPWRWKRQLSLPEFIWRVICPND